MKMFTMTIVVSIATAIASRNQKEQQNNGIGHICEKNNPCVNGATCGYTRGGYICKCPVGWQGENCDEDIDHCAISPCNQGKCVNGEGSYSCECPSGWSGSNCEIDLNECETHSPCNTEGTSDCENIPGSYRCNCNAGYTGKYCEEDIDDCLPNPCINGGECTNTMGSFTCQCESGLTGTFCEQDVDECSVMNPCATSTNCVNTPGSYKCVCYGSLSEPNCAAAGTTLFVCEGGTVNIRCPGANIQIQQAGYGRSEENVCPHPMIQTTDCRAPRSRVIVKGLCEGRRQCHLTATNEAFEGDPCVNTYKYLRVKYICVD
eukprot:XP_011414059.1 PREDICTED: neurogenic locus notch homolog protein 1-like isoform X1 [Crassostrea gigas]